MGPYAILSRNILSYIFLPSLIFTSGRLCYWLFATHKPRSVDPPHIEWRLEMATLFDPPPLWPFATHKPRSVDPPHIEWRLEMATLFDPPPPCLLVMVVRAHLRAPWAWPWCGFGGWPTEARSHLHQSSTLSMLELGALHLSPDRPSTGGPRHLGTLVLER